MQYQPWFPPKWAFDGDNAPEPEWMSSGPTPLPYLPPPDMFNEPHEGGVHRPPYSHNRPSGYMSAREMAQFQREMHEMEFERLIRRIQNARRGGNDWGDPTIDPPPRPVTDAIRMFPHSPPPDDPRHWPPRPAY
jgi:hypothetical protein